MKRLMLIFMIFVLIIFATAPKNALAESISFSAQIDIEINSEPINTVKPKESYTGVIVDCRGLDLRCAMSPTIQIVTGEIIYGDKNLDFDKINEIGMVEYSTNLEDTNRAGDNPLIVKAVRLNNFNSNPVLSVEDAQKVLITDEVSGFLKNLSVIFLMDKI